MITNALAKIQFESCQNHTLAELLDNLREVASIDDLPFQHGTPLVTERETGSGETVLADYDLDLESFSTERLVSVIIQQPEPSHHNPNEALDQISADNLTQDVPPDEDEATRAARRARNQRSAGFMRPNVLVFHRATSTTNSTMSWTLSSEHQLLR